MHTSYCYNHIYIKTIRDLYCFLLSFITYWTIFWSVIIGNVLTWVTRGPLSAYIRYEFETFKIERIRLEA